MSKDEVVKGYKATNANMCCRGFQFELGKWYKHDGKVVMCESGFHFCEYPSGPWAFYRGEGTRIFEVEARGVEKGEGPGADLKHVAMEIRLIKEINVTGHRNTGDQNTGHRNTGDGNTGDGNTGHGNTGHGNTGDRNTGDRNTGDQNTGDGNTGHGNTGFWNTGDWNTGHRNTGHRNTGDQNTGYGNTGYGNTGNGNATDRCSGYLCKNPPPVVIFDLPVKNGQEIPHDLINELANLMLSDKAIVNISKFLAIPNATEQRIRDLHAAHITRRKQLKISK